MNLEEFKHCIKLDSRLLLNNKSDVNLFYLQLNYYYNRDDFDRVLFESTAELHIIFIR